jgi:hypothetical protein
VAAAPSMGLDGDGPRDAVAATATAVVHIRWATHTSPCPAYRSLARASVARDLVAALFAFLSVPPALVGWLLLTSFSSTRPYLLWCLGAKIRDP